MPSPPDGYRNRPRVVLSWALYDFANTIYSAVVVTTFIAVHVKSITGNDTATGAANVLSMMGAGLLVPLLGAWSDRSGATKRALLAATLLCCAACAGIALAGRDALPVLACFVAANIAYQASLVFYDALLPTVATPERVGRISGFGVGLGSLGMACAVLPAFAVRDRWGTGATFLFAGAMFLVFSVPLFLFVRERPPAEGSGEGGAGVWRTVARTFRGILKDRPLALFLLGNFLCFDALNATILFYVPYLKEESGAGFPAEWVKRTLLASSLAVIPLGLLQGWLSDRVPARRVYLAACAAFLVAIVTCRYAEDRRIIAPVLVLCGAAALSGIQATGRKILATMAPPERLGAYFGFYELTNKLSGWQSLFYAMLADAYGYRVAVGLLAFTVVPGAALVWGSGVHGHRREDRPPEST